MELKGCSRIENGKFQCKYSAYLYEDLGNLSEEKESIQDQNPSRLTVQIRGC